MDKKLISLILFVYSLSNFLAFSAMAFPSVRGGCIIALLIGLSIIGLIAFLNYVQSVKAGINSGFDGMFNDSEGLLIGFAPGIFFGVVYLLGIVSGVYLGL